MGTIEALGFRVQSSSIQGGRGGRSLSMAYRGSK